LATSGGFVNPVVTLMAELPIVLAILLRVAIRSAWTPGPRWTPGINLSAKFVLEVAIVMLGAAGGQRRHHRGARILSGARYRLDRRHRYRHELWDLPRTSLAAPHGRSDRLRQFDLR
jgi:hypothetical protein